MPLRLKALELHGYKTFAAKFHFEFSEGITAIVGPNGSGKSNIADALRWVLGEQSYSLLRAKKTEDMIFAGSEQRPRAGMASVTVNFDNTDNWLPVDFSEVALSRRAYRDGRNEYLLNGQHIRLKDINELLSQSGLSERTYTILGQGLVDASLALKADERRRLFEEAAGIGLYRSRREEALRRMEATRRNLDRVLDILSELEPRLRSLERQAARAQEFSRLQADLHLLLRDWYGYHWHHAQQELAEVLEKVHHQDAQVHEVREGYHGLQQKFFAFRDHLNGLRGRLNSWHRQSALLHADRETISSEIATLEERQRALFQQHQALIAENADLDEEIKLAEERLVEASLEANRFQSEFDQAQEQLQKTQEMLNSSLTERTNLEEEISSTRKHIELITGRHAALQARLDELATRGESQKMKLGTICQAIILEQKEVNNAVAAHRQITNHLTHLSKNIATIQTELENIQKNKSDLDEEMRITHTKRLTKDADRARLQAQLDIIQEAERNLAGFSEGAKMLLDITNRSKLKSIKGAFTRSLDIPAEFEAAIAAALGEFSDSVLMQSSLDVDHALTILESDLSSRASILPLDWLKPDDQPSLDTMPDALGLASDLVKSPPDLRPVVDLLLNQVIVVRDRSAARNVLAGQPGTVRAVTLKGEVFHASGQVIAGKPAKAAMLARPRQQRELKEEISGCIKDISGLDLQIQELETLAKSVQVTIQEYELQVKKAASNLEYAQKELQQAQVKVETTQKQLDWHLRQKSLLQDEINLAEVEKTEAAAALSAIEMELGSHQAVLRNEVAKLTGLGLDEIQEQVIHWTSHLAVAGQGLSGMRSRQAERESTIDRLKNDWNKNKKLSLDLEQSLDEIARVKISTQAKAGDFNTQLVHLRTLIEPAEKELETIEQQENELQKQETEGQAVLARVERLNNQLQLELGRKQEALENLRGKIEDDFGLVMFEYASDISGPVPLPLDGMVEQLPVVTELPLDLEENLMRQRAQLRRIGAVNPDALQEYQSVKERHTFLTTQVGDLHKAESDLHQVIAELDELTRQEFQKTFTAVAEHFHTIFHRLFDGGLARLVLTDPENLNESGIDIEARLPGRREQGLALLSGGERSLTAIALVFALLKVSPTPVCVMDEVDAMLDEANVGRFRDLLTELSKGTQFVIITHNRNTVQAADVIYGVTMGRDSTSQVISLKLDEVSEEYYR